MRFLRLLHRRTKSDGDISTLLPRRRSTGVVAPIFVPLPVSLPSFDPARELYALPTDLPQSTMDLDLIDDLNAKIVQMELQLARLRAEHSSLEQDVADYRADLLHTRTELYLEMLSSARQQQRAMDDFGIIQKLEARHQRFCTLLADIGIPRSAVNEICQIIQSGNGSPDDILVDAIKDASNDSSTLLARLKPVIKDDRTPEHYQSALNLTLSIRKELKSKKKQSKFWKKLAQEDARHANTITPSPSDISSIRQNLSPERQGALDALIARRRAAGHSVGADSDGDVFGGHRRESALDSLANSLASRPRNSIQDMLRLSSSVSSTSSTSMPYPSHLLGHSQTSRGSIVETPVIPSRLPSPLSTSLRRSSRGSSQSFVLGTIDLNVSRSSSIDPAFPEELEQQTNPDTGPASMVTVSQELLQNDRRASQGHNHRRISSTASRRPVRTRSVRTSFRLSAVSPIRVSHPTGPSTAPGSDISGHTAVDALPFHTPNAMMRLSDLVAGTNSDSYTPVSSDVTRSDDTPFNDASVLPKYRSDTPLSPTDLEPRVASTPLDGSSAYEPLGGKACSRDTRFLEHLDCSMSMTMSVAASESGADVQDGHDRKNGSNHEHERETNRLYTDLGMGAIPVDESKDSLFTTSASSISADDTTAPTTPPTPSPSPVPDLSATSPISPGTGKAPIGRSMLPVLAKHFRRLSLSGMSPDRERIVDKLRGLRSLSRSRSRSGPGSPHVDVVWQASPAHSESNRSENPTTSPNPVKGSGIPVLQRRMTIRARRMSVRKT